MIKSAWCAAGVTVTTGLLVVALATPASAHVTITPGEAAPGETALISFLVPNETDDTVTTELEVHFPEDTPIPSVRTAQVPGWSVTVERAALDQPIEGHHGQQITEVVSVVTWTADDEDAGIQPGQYGEFAAEIGPLPEAEELFFRTLQTYSDGTIARWIELPANGTEPESPAPSIRLAAEAGEGETGTPPAGGTSAGGDDGSSGDSGTGVIWLALAGLLAGLGGLALGGVAFTRARRP